MEPCKSIPKYYPMPVQEGSLTNEDLLDSSLCNIHIHWKT